MWLRRCSGLSGSADEAIAKDVILQIQLLLAHEVKLSDIAVLMRTGRRAQQLRAALTRAGLPAVLTSSQAVWRQPAATHWLTLLTALADPRQANIRLASLTTADRLRVRHAPARRRPRACARQHPAPGLAVAFGKGRRRGGAHPSPRRRAPEERLLSKPDGDRLLADTAHLAELLDARAAPSAR
ncbi:MAG: hypothetical protein IPJ61_18100 [Tessaracoccus sp.]|uniref:3'-5' exonuclease n=1 Tax=Tessaracoccus sp. TaxID=1971211 RepID=UPI001ED75EEE|nr:3'-5' exonuclease [Tessaracoccus sp.]MBK7822906.1 hypothetical protein [Tessaracoccus sp.]